MTDYTTNVLSKNSDFSHGYCCIKHCLQNQTSESKCTYCKFSASVTTVVFGIVFLLVFSTTFERMKMLCWILPREEGKNFEGLQHLKHEENQICGIPLFSSIKVDCFSRKTIWQGSCADCISPMKVHVTVMKQVLWHPVLQVFWNTPVTWHLEV